MVEVFTAPLNGNFAARCGDHAVEPRVNGTPTWVVGPGGGRQAGHFAVDGKPDIYNLNVPDYVAYPCAPATLREWGAASMWVRHGKDMSEPGSPDTRPLLYIRGQGPKRDSLLLCLIYNELRVRLYDSNGWLCGAAEAPLTRLGTGAWHQYGVAWQPDGLCLHINGQRAAVDRDAVLPDGTQTELYLGWCDGNWVAGLDVADVRMSRGVARLG